MISSVEIGKLFMLCSTILTFGCNEEVNQKNHSGLKEKESNEAYLFFLGTTILHEFMHWGENNNENFTYDGEEGVKFEVYGTNVQPDNARVILNRFE